MTIVPLPPLLLTQDGGSFTVLYARPIATPDEHTGSPLLDITGDCCLDRAEVIELRDYLNQWLEKTKE